MRVYYKGTKKNIFGRFNIWYIENDRLYLWTCLKKWEDFYGETLTEIEEKRSEHFSDILDIGEFERITEEQAFIELL